MIDQETNLPPNGHARHFWSSELAPRERDVIVRMFLRSYAFMEVLYRRASHYQLYAYASYGPFFTLFFSGFVLCSLVLAMVASVHPTGAADLPRSPWIWIVLILGTIWAADRLVDRRIARIPKGERPVGIDEFHTGRERLKLVAEKIALIPLGYVLHLCMSRIFA